MIDDAANSRDRSSVDPDLIARAEALRQRASTRSDLADEIDRGLALARDGDAGAAKVLTAAVAAVDNFRHILAVDGDVTLSLYVRGLLDSALWVLESPSTLPSVAARIREAEELIAQGREEGVAALDAALSFR